LGVAEKETFGKKKMRRFLLLLIGGTFCITTNAQSFDGFLHFDGTGDYADNLGAFNPLPDNSDFTIEFRFRTCATFPTSFNLFDSRPSTAGSGIDAFYSDFLGAVQVIIQGDGGFQDVVYINAPLPVNTLNNGEWKHLAICYNNNDEIASVYLDGVLAAQEDSVSFAPGGGNFVLGASDLGYIWPFPGEMDELRTSNTIRYTNDFLPSGVAFVSDANTTGLWHFNENEGTNVFLDAVNDQSFVGSETTSIIQVIDNNDIEVCPGTEVLLNGHDGFDSYTWTPSTGLNSVSIADPTTTPANSISYALEATQGFCSYSDEVQITIGNLEAEVNGNLSICAGDSTQINVCCGSAYTWTPNIAISNTSSNEPFLFPDETTTYVVEVFESVTCFDLDTITVIVHPTPAVDIIASTDTICLNETELVTFAASEINAASYAWFPFEAVGCPNCQSTSVFATTTTAISLVVTNEFGCIASDEQLFTVLDCVGVDESGLDSWNVFPNPCSDVLNFNGLMREDVIHVYDSTGRLVLTSQGSNPLSMHNINSGSYLIAVESHGSISYKLIQKL
jgi:Concanavalin A-like lectin/glucanases superfamily/Secretion system C-terminal sorting domain